MTTADTEYQAVSKLAKADRHFRYVQYLTAGLIAALFMFAAIRLRACLMWRASCSR